MCKHVAAVLYGVGARLDEEPELLFLLRGVDHEELISAEIGVATAAVGTTGGRRRIADDALSDVFGIDISEDDVPAEAEPSPRRKKDTPKSKKTSKVTDKESVTKKIASRKAEKKETLQRTRNARSVTGKAVAELRAKFGMSQSEFARLLGVSASTIGNWEKRPGTLDLHTRSLDAWKAAKKLTKRLARRKIDDS